MYKSRLPYILAYLTLCIAVIITVLLAALYVRRIDKSKHNAYESASKEINAVTFVIDAGHGGEDGGAFAVDGTAEKDLNLQVSYALSLLFELNGNSTRMTRSDDRLLYDHYNELESYKGKKKLYDLKNRVKIAQEYDDPVFISIHMNKFSSPVYKGLQVYYSQNNEDSRLLAVNVQNNVARHLQTDNKRSVKTSDGSIYVLNNLSCPAILVECGFLSNHEELSLLKSAEYRRDLSSVIFVSAISSCIDKE